MSRYWVVFLGVMVLTLLSLGVSLLLALRGELQPQAASLFETCSTTWKMGFGALVGLIGGKLDADSGSRQAK